MFLKGAFVVCETVKVYFCFSKGTTFTCLSVTVPYKGDTKKSLRRHQLQE